MVPFIVLSAQARNQAIIFNGVDIMDGFLKTNFNGGQNILIHGWNAEVFDYLDLTVPGSHPVTFRFSSNGVQKL